MAKSSSSSSQNKSSPSNTNNERMEETSSSSSSQQHLALAHCMSDDSDEDSFFELEIQDETTTLEQHQKLVARAKDANDYISNKKQYDKSDRKKEIVGQQQQQQPLLIAESFSFEESVVSEQSDVSEFSIEAASIISSVKKHQHAMPSSKLNAKSASSVSRKQSKSSKSAVECFVGNFSFDEESVYENRSTASSSTPSSNSLMGGVGKGGGDSTSQSSPFRSKRPSKKTVNASPSRSVRSTPTNNTTVKASALLATVKNISKRSLTSSQHFKDIESGGSITQNETQWAAKSDDIASRDGLASVSNKRSRKLLYTIGSVLVLAVAAACVLVGMNVIPRPWKENSATLASSGSSSRSNETNAQVPSPMPTQEISILSLPGVPYYADWDIQKCVQDCDGPVPCGGPREQWEKPFETVKGCCAKYFPGKSIGECTFTASDVEESSGSSAVKNPSASPIEIKIKHSDSPTKSPVKSPYAKTDKPTRKEVALTPQPTVGDTNNHADPTIYPTTTAPVTENPSMAPVNAPTQQSTTVPTLKQTHVPSTDPTVVRSLETVEPSLNPTPYPSSDPSESPTTKEPTLHPAVDECYIFYADRNVGLCVPDVCSNEREPWETTYSTEEDCCQENFSWDPEGDCYSSNDGKSIQTHVPTGKIMVDDSPSKSPVVPGSEVDSGAWSSSVACPSDLDGIMLIDFSTVLYYAMVPSKSSDSHDGLLCGRLEYDGIGWVALAISNDGKMTGSEAIIGLPDESTVLKYNLNGMAEVMGKSRQTLLSTSIVQESGKTIMEFTKLLVEDGEIPILEEGVNNFLHARGSDNNLGYHDARLSFELEFDNGIVSRDASAIPTTKPIRLPSAHPSASLSAPPTTEPTTEPTPKPTRRPSPGPSTPPTSLPTAEPTKKPSRKPTPSPTDEPTARPTKKPTREPTMTPTSKPTRSPTAQPVAPTSSPTNEIEHLRTLLIALSPRSSESLYIKSSPQYFAMDWLFDNQDIESYSDEKKVQRWALATVYYALIGAEWYTRKGWMDKDGELVDECSWHGIECNLVGRVIAIDLSANGLMGNIPDEIVLLENCEYLGLSKNYLISIQASLFGMTSLKILDLDDNRIKELPSEISVASTLEELYLSHNKIRFIPDQLFQLQYLKILWLFDNEISSTVPSGLGSMTSLVELDLEANFLTGAIGTEIFGLSRLESMYLYDNIITGEFSPMFSRMTKLSILDLDTNYISGELPSDIGLFVNLTHLYLHDNEISGQLPDELSQLSSLKVLDMSLNYLNSTIVFDIGSLSNLETLRLDNNYRLDKDGNVDSFGILGAIPESIGSLNQLQELRLDNNFVGGTLPTTLGRLKSLVTLRLESNDLKGNIPKALGNAINLQYLHLWSNYLTGTISSQLGRLTNINELFLDDNDLTGFIPTELGQLASASYISMAQNGIEGVIPTEFGMLQKIEKLDLQNNNLYGEIPFQLGDLPLMELQLQGNYLYGDIPEGVCKSNSLEYISANCASTRKPTQSPTSKPTSSSDDPSLNIPTASPTYEYWWSCNCCTYCFPQ